MGCVEMQKEQRDEELQGAETRHIWPTWTVGVLGHAR